MTNERANEILNELRESEYFNSLSASNLYEALCERLEERMSLEESEIKTILCIIADRLGRLEEIERPCEHQWQTSQHHDTGAHSAQCQKCGRYESA